MRTKSWWASDDKKVALYLSGKLSCFKTQRGLIERCIYYEALIDGDTVLIDSPEKFREVFAPVDNEQEAIAFAHFFTDSYPIYNLNFLIEDQVDVDTTEYDTLRVNGKEVIIHAIVPIHINEWHIYLPSISSSYIKKVTDGYELLLYKYMFLSCSHPYSQQLIKVFTDGRVEAIDSQDAFQEISDMGHCID